MGVRGPVRLPTPVLLLATAALATAALAGCGGDGGPGGTPPATTPPDGDRPVTETDPAPSHRRDGTTTGELVVTVVDGDGEPVAGACLTGRPLDPGATELSEQPRCTGADGRYKLARLAPGRYEFAASYRDQGESAETAPAQVTVTAGETATLELILAR